MLTNTQSVQRDAKGWRVFVTTQMMDVPVVKHLTSDRPTRATQNPTHRRGTPPLTGPTRSPLSATSSGCRTVPQTTTRSSIQHNLGTAKPPPIPGSQRTASRPPTQTCPGSTRQPLCRPRPCAPPLEPPSNRHAGYRSIQTAPRRWLSTLGSPPAVGATTSPSRSCSQAFRQFGDISPAW